MKKIYAMMAAASLCAASASAATPFSSAFAKAVESQIANAEPVHVEFSDKALELNKEVMNNPMLNKRASRAESELPAFADAYTMMISDEEGTYRNYFTIDFDGNETVTFNNWFALFGPNYTYNPIVGTYTMETWKVSGKPQDLPTIAMESGQVLVNEYQTSTSGIKELKLYYCDADELIVYSDSINFVVDEMGNLMEPYGLQFFLGWDETKGMRGFFLDASFSGIRGYQETSIAQIKSDYSGFEFVQYEDEETHETSPFTFNLNYMYDEAENLLWVTNLGLAENAIPFTIDGNDAYVEKPYYIYDLYDQNGNPLDEGAFIATVTLDGITANLFGGGCAATIDNSDPENTIINIDGIWGGFYDDNNTIVPIELDENLYSIFSNTKLTLYGKPFVSAGVGSVAVDNNANAPVEYYNLQGVKVLNPAAGQLVIKKQGTKTTKMIMR